MITVVMPTMNEEKSIGEAINRVKKALSGRSYEIVVVDESTDNTAEIANRAGARIIKPKKHLGLGAALKLGLKGARGDIVVTMDADLSHKPEEIKRLLEDIDGFDLVLGSRYVMGAKRADSMARRVAPLIASILYRIRGVGVRDLTTGFRAYKKQVLKKVDLNKLPDTYAFQSSIVLGLVKKKARIKEVAITFERRHAGESKYSIKELVSNLRVMLGG